MGKTKNIAGVFVGLSMAVNLAVCTFFGDTAQAQIHRNLFRQRPVPAQPGANSIAAEEGDVDETILALPPDQMTISLPGKPDILVERDSHERRSQRKMVWRGRLRSDLNSNVTLTFHEGLLVGRIESGGDTYAIQPSRNGRSLIEKLDPASFAPEWGHDHATHGHEMVPPSADFGLPGSGDAPIISAPAPGATTEIVLMSVYTPQARIAAGGTAQIQAKIQAAVDQANTAFINSTMSARYLLAQSQEVAYSDSGSIDSDLTWVTSNSTVLSLRNTHSADMVSLIVANGGGYCGVGWIQRNPGQGFANYAFQVTAQNCLANSTLAHEHGHNLGMEHDPPNAGVSPSNASYPWSFGHSVNGSFRTIMAYNDCSMGCPRILRFSNPDVLYNGVPTGILDQRDNAWTGDLTAPIVASFRAGGGTTANNPPAFVNDPVTKPNATLGVPYSGSLSANASDSDGDSLTFAKISGPAWLSVASNGILTGKPGATDVGLSAFTVSVSDGKGGSDTAALQINVFSTLTTPGNLAATSTVARQIDLTWTDSSWGEKGFKIERSTDGINFRQVARVTGGATSFLNRRLRPGTTYYYRVRAYYRTQNSAYSNSSSATAN